MLPLQFFISASQDWILTRIKREMPSSIVINRGELDIRNIELLGETDSLLGLRIDLELNMKGPMGTTVSGLLQLDLNIASLADWKALDMNVSGFRWINGPFVKLWRIPLSFAKKKVNQEIESLMKHAPKMMADAVKYKISQLLVRPILRPLKLPSIKTFDDKIHFLELETIWYQSKKEKDYLEFGIFPSSNLYLGKEQYPTDLAPIILEPGVGGNQCQANVTFSEAQINVLAKENMIGRVFEIKGYHFTIDDVVLICSEKKLNVVCRFKEYPLAPLELELALILSEEKQELSFDLLEFSWKPDNLLLKAVILFFKNRIIKEFEEKLKVDLKLMFEKQLNTLKGKIQEVLKEEELILKNWTPNIFLNTLESSSTKIRSTGQVIGQVHIQSTSKKDELLQLTNENPSV